MQTPDRKRGSRYFVTFLDDFSRLSWVTLVKTKDEVAKVFKRWIRYVERESGAKVKVLRSDRGGEYLGKELQIFLEEKGISHQLSWGIFLGVSERSKAWVLWSVADQRVMESRDVIFHEGLNYKGFYPSASHAGRCA
ncbi:hypothetical protein CLOP_g15944 [Closterium sp. NIES-67]|nr:hypothetical protein CLOP_g15944 [Closterium sp. NIES-67]